MKMLILFFSLFASFAFAQVAPTNVKVPGNDQYSMVSAWKLGTGQTGAAIQMPGYTLKTVQFSGTFGGSTVQLEGSNDGVNYVILRDKGSSSASLATSSAIMRAVLENPRYIRGTTSGGTSVSADVTLIMTR